MKAITIYDSTSLDAILAAAYLTNYYATLSTPITPIIKSYAEIIGFNETAANSFVSSFDDETIIVLCGIDKHISDTTVIKGAYTKCKDNFCVLCDDTDLSLLNLPSYTGISGVRKSNTSVLYDLYLFLVGQFGVLNGTEAIPEFILAVNAYLTGNTKSTYYTDGEKISLSLATKDYSDIVDELPGYIETGITELVNDGGDKLTEQLPYIESGAYQTASTNWIVTATKNSTVYNFSCYALFMPLEISLTNISTDKDFVINITHLPNDNWQLDIYKKMTYSISELEVASPINGNKYIQVSTTGNIGNEEEIVFDSNTMTTTNFKYYTPDNYWKYSIAELSSCAAIPGKLVYSNSTCARSILTQSQFISLIKSKEITL